MIPLLGDEKPVPPPHSVKRAALRRNEKSRTR